jgi:hypothetical protein
VIVLNPVCVQDLLPHLLDLVWDRVPRQSGDCSESCVCAGPVTAFIGPGVGPGAQREAAGGQGLRTGPT